MKEGSLTNRMCEWRWGKDTIISLYIQVTWLPRVTSNNNNIISDEKFGKPRTAGSTKKISL